MLPRGGTKKCPPMHMLSYAPEVSPVLFNKHLPIVYTNPDFRYDYIKLFRLFLYLWINCFLQCELFYNSIDLLSLKKVYLEYRMPSSKNNLKGIESLSQTQIF